MVQPTWFQATSDRIVRSLSQRGAVKGKTYELTDSALEARLAQLETSQALAIAPEKRPVRSKPAMRTSSLQEAWESAFRRGLTNASAYMLASSYGASITGYACAQHNANTMSSVKLKILKPDGQPYEEIPPAMAWLENNRRDLLWHISVSLDLWGKAYLRKVRNPWINPQTGLGFPSQLEWLNPVNVWEEIDSSTEEVTRYRVGINQEVVLPRDMVVIPGFDPRNANGAISRFEVALRNITVERNMVNYSAGFFLRNATPDGIVNVSDDGADDDYVKQVRKDWDDLFGGPSNSHRTAFFGAEGGVTYTPLQSALKDLAMEELDAQTVSKIAAALRVNPVLIGMAYVADALSAQNTRDSISRDHYNTVTLPDLEIVLEHLNRQWAWSEFDPPKIFTIVADVSDIAVLTPLTDKRGDLARSMREADLTTRSEGRIYLGLEATEEGVIEFERDPTRALAALQAGGMSLAQYQEFMNWPDFGENSQVIQIAGQWFPVSQLLEVAESNVSALASQGGPFGGFPIFPSGPAEPSTPDLLPAGKQESLPANIEASQSLNGAQISSALAVIAGVTDGTVAPDAAIELLNALGIQRDKAEKMVQSQAGIVITLPPTETTITASGFEQRRELTNWQRKVEKRGVDVAFEPKYLSTEVYEYVRRALDIDADLTLAFDAARNWVTSGEQPPEPAPVRQVEDESDEVLPGEDPQDPKAMSAEAIEFWKRYDELKHDIGADWLEWMGGVGETMISQIVADPEASLESRESLNADALLDTWVGTEGEPGPLLALTLAGMAAGNDALEREVTTNPENAPSRAGPEQTLVVGWDVLSKEALAFVRDFTENLITGINETTFNRIQKIIRAWIESGEPLTALRASLNEIFSDVKRAGVIAQTESTRVYAAGAVTRFENAGITKVNWHTVRTDSVCPECRGYAKNSPVSIKDGWAKRDNKGEIISGTKTVKMPPAHVGCILPGNEIEIPGQLLAAAKSFYNGPCIEFTLADGRSFTVTENHPVLTPGGWVAAKLLNKFEDVIITADSQGITTAINPDNDHVPTRIEEIFSALSKTAHLFIEGEVSPDAFHGDGKDVRNTQVLVAPSCFYSDCNCDVRVERSKEDGRHLEAMEQYDLETSLQELQDVNIIGKFLHHDYRHDASLSLQPRDYWPQPVFGVAFQESSIDAFDKKHAQSHVAVQGGQLTKCAAHAPLHLASPHVSFDSEHYAYEKAHVLSPDSFDDAHARNKLNTTLDISTSFPFDTRCKYPCEYHTIKSGNAQGDKALYSDFLSRFADEIKSCEIASIRHYNFCGYVYDLQVDPYSLFICNGVIVKNCRCWVSPDFSSRQSPGQIDPAGIAVTGETF